jgi:hypothetical protein
MTGSAGILPARDDKGGFRPDTRPLSPEDPRRVGTAHRWPDANTGRKVGTAHPTGAFNSVWLPSSETVQEFDVGWTKRSVPNIGRM